MPRGFGLRRRRTVEEMLEVLRPHGITLSDGASVEDLTAEWGREEIEQAGFELLLVALGGECIEPSHSTLEAGYLGQPLIQRQQYSCSLISDDVWHLDYECIDDIDNYLMIVDRLASLTRGDLVLNEPNHFLDFGSGQAFVDLGITSQPLRLTYNTDWLDPAVIYACNDRLIDLGSPKRFAAHSTGQAALIICQSPDRIAALNVATGLQFAQKCD